MQKLFLVKVKKDIIRGYYQGGKHDHKIKM